MEEGDVKEGERKCETERMGGEKVSKEQKEACKIKSR